MTTRHHARIATETERCRGEFMNPDWKPSPQLAAIWPEPEACDHEWEFIDDSFDHEWGCEQAHSWECQKCGETVYTCPFSYEP